MHGGPGALLPSTGSGSTPFTGSASGYSEDMHVMPGCAVLLTPLTWQEEEGGEAGLCCGNTVLFTHLCSAQLRTCSSALENVLSSGSCSQRGCGRKKVQPLVAVWAPAPVAGGAGGRTVKGLRIQLHIAALRAQVPAAEGAGGKVAGVARQPRDAGRDPGVDAGARGGADPAQAQAHGQQPGDCRALAPLCRF